MATLLQDNFAGTDGVSIDSRPMVVGPGWSIATGGNTGGWVVDSARARETGTLPITSSIAISDSGASTAVVSATVRVPSTASDSAVGVLARMSADFANGWLGWVDVFDQRIVISERTSGFFVLRAELPVSLSYDTDYEVTLTCAGSVFTLEVAGVGSVDYTSTADLTNTNFGIYGDTAVGQFISSFLVVTLGGNRTFFCDTFASKTFACGTFRGAGVVPPPPTGGMRTFFCNTFASKTFACRTFRGTGVIPPPAPTPFRVGTLTGGEPGGTLRGG